MILADQAAAVGATTAASMVDSSMTFMVIFDIFIAVYLLYYAIKGEGKLYETGDYPKEMREEHAKILRKFCWIVGIPMLVLSILEYIYSYNSIWGIILIAYVLTCVVVYFIIFQVRFRKYLRPEKNTGVKKKK